MDWLSITGNFASIVGLMVSCFALVFAKGAQDAARQARAAVRKSNATEALSRIGDTANLLQASLENNQQHELLVRARDLGSEITRVRHRFERFLDVRSRSRLDESREQVSVISREIFARGMPETPAEKERILKICHNDIVAVLNEESAKIRASIESEEE